MLTIYLEGQGCSKSTGEEGYGAQAQGGYEADDTEGEARTETEEAREARLGRGELRPRRRLDG